MAARIASDSGMRVVNLIASASLVTTLVALAGAASAEEIACGDPQGRALIAAVARLPGSASLRVVRAAHKVELVDVASRRVVLEATCEGVRVPLPEALRRPARVAPSVTRVDGPYTVSVTARGATSLSIAAGVAAPDAIEIVSFDDDSVTIADGRDRTWYSVALRPDGTRVEVEGAHVGCGCERTTHPDGRRSERRL